MSVANYNPPLHRVFLKGRGIYDELWMPVVPRKGDILWLSSLTRGRVKALEGQVSKVEWSQTQRILDGTGINAWVTVRITKEPPEEEVP